MIIDLHVSWEVTRGVWSPGVAESLPALRKLDSQLLALDSLINYRLFSNHCIALFMSRQSSYDPLLMTKLASSVNQNRLPVMSVTRSDVPVTTVSLVWHRRCHLVRVVTFGPLVSRLTRLTFLKENGFVANYTFCQAVNSDCFIVSYELSKRLIYSLNALQCRFMLYEFAWCFTVKICKLTSVTNKDCWMWCVCVQNLLLMLDNVVKAPIWHASETLKYSSHYMSDTI